MTNLLCRAINPVGVRVLGSEGEDTTQSIDITHIPRAEVERHEKHFVRIAVSSCVRALVAARQRSPPRGPRAPRHRRRFRLSSFSFSSVVNGFNGFDCRPQPREPKRSLESGTPRGLRRTVNSDAERAREWIKPEDSRADKSGFFASRW
jgi:hypothetical protein